jgi:hypothetical protein
LPGGSETVPDGSIAAAAAQNNIPVATAAFIRMESIGALEFRRT